MFKCFPYHKVINILAYFIEMFLWLYLMSLTHLEFFNDVWVPKGRGGLGMIKEIKETQCGRIIII